MTPEKLKKEIETTVAALDAEVARDIAANSSCDSPDYDRGLKMGTVIGVLKLSHLGFELIENYSQFSAWRDGLLALPKTRAAFAAKHLRVARAA